MEIDLPEVVAEVKAAFDRYVKALTTNDLAVLNTIFRDAAVAVLGATNATDEMVGHLRHRHALRVTRATGDQYRDDAPACRPSIRPRAFSLP
jgi:hypothetical protein